MEKQGRKETEEGRGNTRSRRGQLLPAEVARQTCGAAVRGGAGRLFVFRFPSCQFLCFFLFFSPWGEPHKTCVMMMSTNISRTFILVAQENYPAV